MSLINTEVKPFNATAYHNGQFIEVSEQDMKGKWSVVFFYPADFTFVCPTALEDLADNYAEFQKLGVEIYGVSTDTHFTHKAWHDTSDAIKKIQYPLIGDPTWTLSKNFDVLIESEGLADRGTFVIDPEGKIQIVEINAGGIGRDAQELLRKVKAAQYVHAHPGEVCPAKWKEGEATLAPSLSAPTKSHLSTMGRRRAIGIFYSLWLVHLAMLLLPWGLPALWLAAGCLLLVLCRGFP